jgi:membrane protease YdiL (CAAX protease family)
MSKSLLPLKALAYSAFATLIPFVIIVVIFNALFNGIAPAPWNWVLNALLFPCVALASFLSPRFFKGEIFPLNTITFKQLLPYILAIACVYGVIILIAQFNPSFFSKSPLVGVETWGERAVILVLILILAPIAEEMLFRGLLMRVFYDAWGKWVALGVTTLLFALIHGFNLDKLIIITCLGLIFGLARLNLNSLKASILLHALNNLVPTFFLLNIWMK